MLSPIRAGSINTCPLEQKRYIVQQIKRLLRSLLMYKIKINTTNRYINSTYVISSVLQLTFHS